LIRPLWVNEHGLPKSFQLFIWVFILIGPHGDSRGHLNLSIKKAVGHFGYEHPEIKNALF
jgi:hypothetical protein